MDVVGFLRGLQGSFHFLHPSGVELRRLLESSGVMIPAPQPVFLEGELPTSLHGYLVRESSASLALEEALRRLVHALEAALLSSVDLDEAAEQSPDWLEYERLLASACENVTASDYGRHYPAVFWLDHSTHIAHLVRSTPQGLASRASGPSPSEVARMRFALLDALTHRIDGVLETVRGRVETILQDDGEPYPELFRCMRDNVLIFSESGIAAGLFGLDGYLQTQFDIDGHDFRQRCHALVHWHRERTDEEPRLQSLGSFLGRLLDDLPADRLLTVPGYVTFLASAPTWDSGRLWSPQQVEIWKELLQRLKVFELFNGLRYLTIRVRRFDDRLVCPATEVARMGAGQTIFTCRRPCARSTSPPPGSSTRGSHAPGWCTTSST